MFYEREIGTGALNDMSGSHVFESSTRASTGTKDILNSKFGLQEMKRIPMKVKPSLKSTSKREQNKTPLCLTS